VILTAAPNHCFTPLCFDPTCQFTPHINFPSLKIWFNALWLVCLRIFPLFSRKYHFFFTPFSFMSTFPAMRLGHKTNCRVMRRLTTGIRSEKRVFRQFRCHANIINVLTQTLKPGIDLASFWMKFLSVIRFQLREVSSILKIWRFALASNFPPQSAYLEFPKIQTTIAYAVRRWPERRYAVQDCVWWFMCVIAQRLGSSVLSGQ
jgi:hypothetical protein